MPTKKTTTKKTVEPTEELMEFDQFVSQTPKSSGGRSWLALTIIVIIIILAGAVYWLNQGQLGKEIKYKSVFLDNGQIYFAKVVKEDSLNLYLDDVFYIQTQQQLIPATEEGQEDQVVDVPSLVKRGTEYHQPQGLLQINRDRMVSMEEIGPDSEIMKEIQRINTGQ